MTYREYSQNNQNSVNEKYKLISSASSVLLFTQKGMTATESNKMRRMFDDLGTRIKLVKNTLLKVAAEKSGIEGIENLISGQCGMLCVDDYVSCAKIFSECEREFGMSFSILGGVIDNKIFDADAVRDIAALPSLNVLRAQMLCILQQPARNFLSSCQGVARLFINVIMEYSKVKGDT